MKVKVEELSEDYEAVRVYEDGKYHIKFVPAKVKENIWI